MLDNSSKMPDSAGTPQNSLAKKSELQQVCLAQSCKTLVSCSRRLLESTASGDIQAEPTSSAFNSLSASAIYNTMFVPPCQYLIQELGKSYKHRKVLISH